MSFDLSISFDAASPDDCPLTFAEMVALLDTLISGTLEGEFLPYITGAATPDVDDQDKVWMRVDAQGRPIGTYVFYNGTWRKQYSVPVGTVAMYFGDPTVDFAGTGGAGVVGGEWDGWQLCNGLNGSPNLSDKFPVGAKMDDLGTGYPNGDGPWTTTVTGESEVSGVGGITLSEENTYIPATNALTLGHWEADGNAPNAGGGLIGLESGALPSANFDLIAGDEGNITPPAIPTIPPFTACAFVVFQGYS